MVQVRIKCFKYGISSAYKTVHDYLFIQVKMKWICFTHNLIWSEIQPHYFYTEEPDIVLGLAERLSPVCVRNLEMLSGCILVIWIQLIVGSVKLCTRLMSPMSRQWGPSPVTLQVRHCSFLWHNQATFI